MIVKAQMQTVGNKTVITYLISGLRWYATDLYELQITVGGDFSQTVAWWLATLCHMALIWQPTTAEKCLK